MIREFTVCGYCMSGGGKAQIIFGEKEGDRCVFLGVFPMHLSDEAFIRIAKTDSVKKDKYYERFPDFPGADWLKPELSCTLEYMEKKPEGGPEQPVFRGVGEARETADRRVW